jgi:hypothetical protein
MGTTAFQNIRGFQASYTKENLSWYPVELAIQCTHYFEDSSSLWTFVILWIAFPKDLSFKLSIQASSPSSPNYLQV